MTILKEVKQASWLSFALLAFVAMIVLAAERHLAFFPVTFLGFAPALGGYIACRKSQRLTLRGAIQLTLSALCFASVVEFVWYVGKEFPQRLDAEAIGGFPIVFFVWSFMGAISATIMEVLSRFIGWLGWLVSKQYLDDERGQTK